MTWTSALWLSELTLCSVCIAPGLGFISFHLQMYDISNHL